MKKIFLVLLMIFQVPAVFAANVEQKPVEIPGRTAVDIENAQKPVKAEKIEAEEKPVVMPELPKPIKPGKPSEAEKLRIDRLEQAQAAGAGLITETEAAVEKDNQKRDANLKF